jgi:hypothetical protein
MRRQHRVLSTCVVMATILGSTLLMTDAIAASSFTSFSPPITGATDYATDFPSSGFGPAGVLHDGTSFFAFNEGDGRLYKFPATGGSATTAQSAPEPFNYGIGLAHGVYYASSGNSVVTFDPVTLVAGPPANFSLPCATFSIVPDPLSLDIFLSSFCGIYRVAAPDSATPVVTQVSPTQDFYDGLAITNDGQHVWGAEYFQGNVVEISRTGALEQTIFIGSGLPDGIAIAQPNTIIGTTDVSNNVFVNENNGTVQRIDTNNGNAVTTVASGGTRGDMATVGPDGCFYVTQSDRVEKLSPCFFQPSSPSLFLGSGSFVVGDRSATLGSTVTYWGAQWWKKNALSGGPAPAAFKGFADHTSSSPPTCGGTWTTAPGNSSHPPDSVPSEMAVIVSSSVTKTGPTISGDIPEIVVITTDPGYGPNPGHAGTGRVVSILCHA